MKNSLREQIYIASTLGLSFLSNILVGAFLGYFLSSYFSYPPLFFVFLLFGILAGIRTLYRDIKRLLRTYNE